MRESIFRLLQARSDIPLPFSWYLYIRRWLPGVRTQPTTRSARSRSIRFAHERVSSLTGYVAKPITRRPRFAGRHRVSDEIDLSDPDELDIYGLRFFSRIVPPGLQLPTSLASVRFRTVRPPGSDLLLAALVSHPPPVSGISSEIRCGCGGGGALLSPISSEIRCGWGRTALTHFI